MQRRNGHSQAHCLRTLKETAPELYADIHPSTPARWQRPAQEAAPSNQCWVQQAISPGALLRLCEVVKKLTAQLSLSASVIRQILVKELEILKEPRPGLSVTWVKKFLQETNYSYKHSALGTAARLSYDEIQDAQGNLRLKVAWLQKHHRIPWNRVWNMDETAVKLLPTYKKGWSLVRDSSKTLGDTHTNVTATVMHGTMPGDLLVQIIFRGKTCRSLPADTGHSESIQLTMTENHWCTTESVLSCIAMIDEKINKETPKQPWVKDEGEGDPKQKERAAPAAKGPDQEGACRSQEEMEVDSAIGATQDYGGGGACRSSNTRNPDDTEQEMPATTRRRAGPAT